MINERLLPQPDIAPSGNLPSGYFNTVLYTGNGSTQKIGGYINRAAVFNGSNSNISIPLSSWIASASAKSCSVWFKTSATGGGNRDIISDYGSGASYNFDCYLTPTDGKIKLVTKRGTNYEGTSINSFNDGEWHLAVIVDDIPNGNAKLYVDNNQEISVSTDSGAVASTVLYIGTYGAGYYWDGSIDQVRIFDKALSSGERTTLYEETHASASKTVTDIFSDGSGVALYRLDGNANDEGVPNTLVSSGQSAAFNGSSSKIDLPDSIGTAMGNNNFSVSFWVYVNDPSNDEIYLSITRPYDFYVRSFSGGTVFLNLGTLGYDTGISLSTGWHHIAVTKSSSSGSILYLDNNAYADTSKTGNITSGSIPNSIGHYNGGTYVVNGRMDNVRIYDSVLSSSDVSNLYNETNAPTSNLIAHYKFDGDVTDEQGSYNGTATNITYSDPAENGTNYSGTATNVTYQDATNFSPDLVWIKKRSSSTNADHMVFDSVRGADKVIIPNSTQGQYDGGGTGYQSSFDSNGFSITGNAFVNQASQTFVSWCFNAGGSPTATNSAGAGNSPTSGSVMIDGVSSSAALGGNVEAKKMSVNTNAQFSIVEFTSVSGSTNQVPHGLNGVPDLFIFKKLAGSTGSGGWWAYTQVIDGSLDYFALNTNEAKSNSSETAPTATAVYQPTSTAGRDYILYSFKNVDGIQKVGTYTGNGSTNGTIVEIGFEPAFIMTKGVDGDRWLIADNKRHEAINNNAFLDPGDSHVESSFGSGNGVTFLSNGFQLKSNDNVLNGTNKEYLYLAIAADPDTTTPTVEDSFEVVTYTGNAGAKSIDTGFKPDLIWIKDRVGTDNHHLFDSIRGTNQRIISNSSAAENTEVDCLNSFDENGFTIGANSGVNASGENHVAWCWKAGDHDDNLPEINDNGTIDSVVSVNDAAGFSIVKYTATGTTGTVGHGLSSAPELIISKTTSAAYDWLVYAAPVGATKQMRLNATTGANTSGFMNNTAPTSSVYTVASGNNLNYANGDVNVAYCFTSITGYQKIGSYSSDGNNKTINVGFSPRWVMIKNYSSAGNYWVVFDNLRTTGTNGKNRIYANTAQQEDTSIDISFNATDFTLLTSNGDVNGSGKSYIYLAIK